MPWFRLDENFYLHPKVSGAGNAATGLWVRCGTYSAHYLTDGHIPAAIARQMGTRGEIAALLDSGLWAANGDGFVIPDFLEYQPSRTEVAKRREKEAEKKRQQRGTVDHSPINGQFMSRNMSPGDNPGDYPGDSP
jgi:hypothetical protein